MSGGCLVQVECCTLLHAIKVIGSLRHDWNKMFLFSRKSRDGQWMIKFNMNYEGNEAA